MKLAVLGVVTAGVGVALTIPGLVGVGLLWVALGFVARAYRTRLEEHRTETDTAVTTTSTASRSTRVPAIDAATFAQGTLVWLAIGVPSVAVGVFRLGIDAEDSAWRWLPIGVGGLALAIGVIGALMYGLGSAALAAGDGIGVADKPATLWIRSLKETGTFVNERPRLEFGFHVEPDAATGLAPYDVTKKATVPFTAMGALHVGDGFRATVAGPDKPTAMEIDWATPVPGPVGGGTEVSSRLDALDRLRRDGRITEQEYQAQRQRILGSL